MTTTTQEIAVGTKVRLTVDGLVVPKGTEATVIESRQEPLDHAPSWSDPDADKEATEALYGEPVDWGGPLLDTGYDYRLDVVGALGIPLSVYRREIEPV